MLLPPINHCTVITTLKGLRPTGDLLIPITVVNGCFAKLLFPLSFNFLLSHVERLKNEAHKVLLSCSDRLVTNSLALSEFLLSGGNVSQGRIVSVVDFHQQFVSCFCAAGGSEACMCVSTSYFLLNGPVSVAVYFYIQNKQRCVWDHWGCCSSQSVHLALSANYKRLLLTLWRRSIWWDNLNSISVCNLDKWYWLTFGSFCLLQVEFQTKSLGCRICSLVYYPT